MISERGPVGSVFLRYARRSQIPTRAQTPPPPTRRAGELTSLSHLEVARHVPVAISVVVPVGGLGPCHAHAALRLDFDSSRLAEMVRPHGASAAPPIAAAPRPAPGADLRSCRAERRACSAGFRPDMPTDERLARVGRAPRFSAARAHRRGHRRGRRLERRSSRRACRSPRKSVRAARTTKRHRAAAWSPPRVAPSRRLSER